MPIPQQYDVAIIGGGLAGLSLSIQLARTGRSVVLFEKHSYPFHRVCGEYISNESYDFLQSLGVDISKSGASSITQLEITTSNNVRLRQALQTGGFGISRYKLDSELAQIAKGEGVHILESTTVWSVNFTNDKFSIDTSAGTFTSAVAAGCFGKRSKLDQHWNRPFMNASRGKDNNYIGVKYHVKASLPADTIFLHQFAGGYCGVVKVEDDKYCLCYLTTAKQLASVGNQVSELERKILSNNTQLKSVLDQAEYISTNPVVISQISFAKKTQVEDHVLMIGDAAGMITPLCGNGMSMALHASKMAFEQINEYLSNHNDRERMEKVYTHQWRKEFSRRLWVGRKVQNIFNNSFMLSGLIKAGKLFPAITRGIVRQTHGRLF